MACTILGISAFYHDAAAAIVQDGVIVAAAQEERFTRKKHDPRFPVHAINYCLEEAFIEAEELDAIVFYDNPLLTLDRVLKSLLTVAPNGYEQWRVAAQSVLGIKLFITDYIRRSLQTDVDVLYTHHHPAHAASAFYPSPFEEAAILTMDGVGEWATTTIGHGRDRDVHIHKQINYPHSLGLLYSAFTYFTGFKVNSGEYKLMGLAPYGEPKYADVIKDRLIHILPDGSFRLDTEYFGFLDTTRMTNDRFDELFGGPPRDPRNRITQREMDIAASVQKVVEEGVLKLARQAKVLTGSDNLVLAGGVALNCVANGLLLREQVFDNLWIQPAAGDAGGALGAALLASYSHFDVKRRLGKNGRDTQKGSYLGPSFSSNEIFAFLDKDSLPYKKYDDHEERNLTIAQAISQGKIVGYFTGRMEFGPRALGARSILGDPRNPATQVTMNLKIKHRESFRPFAPSVLAEQASTFFELTEESPYMLLVVPVREDRRLNTEKIVHGDDVDMLEIVRQKRSDIPAITHVDYSARVQTVHHEDKPDYYDVLEAFKKLTGYGIVVNTSFNVRGEPIVCTPRDAYLCFMSTDMDMLVLENYVLLKEDQPPLKAEQNRLQAYLVDDLPDDSDAAANLDGERTRLVTDFYEAYLLPAAQKLKDRGVRFLALTIDEKAGTYYDSVEDNICNTFELETETLAKSLKLKWTEQALPELANMVDPLMELADNLRQEELEEEVSPYIYAMF